MRSVVALWQGLVPALTEALDDYASAYGISGFNTWCSMNILRTKIADALLPNIMPPDPKANPIEGFTAEAAELEGSIIVNWTVTGWEEADKAYMILLPESDLTYYAGPIIKGPYDGNQGNVQLLSLDPAETYTIVFSINQESSGRWATTVGLKNVAPGEAE